MVSVGGPKRMFYATKSHRMLQNLPYIKLRNPAKQGRNAVDDQTHCPITVQALGKSFVCNSLTVHNEGYETHELQTHESTTT